MLYRKYRPKKFGDVVGQEHIVRTLTNSLQAGSIAHAYLLSGPRGTGKTSIARLLAKAGNCEAPKGDVCGECESCKSIDGGAIDLLEIDAASNTQVEKIRDLVDKVKQVPTVLKKKVYIIDEVHMLSSASFNALLKTLEEPPPHAMFILATTELHKVPETILSRTQHFSFKRFGVTQTADYLFLIADAEKIKLSRSGAVMIAEAAEGGMRDALSILDQVYAMSGGEITAAKVEQTLGVPDFKAVMKLLSHILKKDLKNSLLYLSELTASGLDIEQLTKAMSKLLRKLVFASATSDGFDGEERADELKNILSLASEAELVLLLDTTLTSLKEIKRSVTPEILLELCIYKYIGLSGAVKNASVEKKETKPIIDAPKGAAPDLEFKWGELLAEIKGESTSIHALIKAAEPKTDGGKLILHFDYSFHKERLEDRRNADVFDKAIRKIYGDEIEYELVLNTRERQKSDIYSVKTELNEDIVTTAMEILGGEVVED